MSHSVVEAYIHNNRCTIETCAYVIEFLNTIHIKWILSPYNPINSVHALYKDSLTHVALIFNDVLFFS